MEKLFCKNCEQTSIEEDLIDGLWCPWCVEYNENDEVDNNLSHDVFAQVWECDDCGADLPDGQDLCKKCKHERYAAFQYDRMKEVMRGLV